MKNSYTLVKVIRHEGEVINETNPRWCLLSCFGDACRTLCSGVPIGYGESDTIFKQKHTGVPTCPLCIEMITFFKSVRL